uniref:Uncharacterized protein n=1 Tax=Rangifer tarandus platyrhynchus TaxID=3082113 RepID=A0ACB0F8W7_RANTA|nr:unnamed protein product [Rangifer tarandus platyrhynchus]
MAALSSLKGTPSPEPVHKDFHSESGNRTTGEMENYELIPSSRVKLPEPREEEILLLEEDVVRYPLSELASEPPQRGWYWLQDGRRSRGLGRWEALCGQERPVGLTAEARPGGSWSLCSQCLAQCPPGAGKPLLFSKCFLFQYPLLIVLPENVNTSIQLAVSNLGGEGAVPADLWPTPLLLCGRLHQCPVFCRGCAVNMCEKTGIPGLGERAVNVQRQERGWGSDGTTALAEVRGTARQRPGIKTILRFRGGSFAVCEEGPCSSL